jgi:hypothetical protein
MGNPVGQRTCNQHQSDGRNEPEEAANCKADREARGFETSASSIAASNASAFSSSRSNSAVSTTVVAILLFAGLNFVWAKSQIGLLSALDYPRQTWTGTAIDDFLRSSKQRAQVTFLGSSLMVTPIISVDADYLHEKMDAPYHHRSVFFQDKYKELTGQALTTFNFAIPGEMPSDAFLITKFLLKGEQRPDVLVYGVGPRDFIDNLLPSASATDPYKHLARMGEMPNNDSLAQADWQKTLNERLGRLFFTYGHKDDIACSFNRFAGKFVLPNLPPETAQQEWEYKQMVIPNVQEFEVLPKECLVAPTKTGKENQFKDNLAEYRDRYHELKWDTFLTQMQFLGETLDLANERKIHPVLVAMPITEGNRGLITDFVWDLYKKNLRVVAQAKHATFIDMATAQKFDGNDFADTVHLNARGGTKLLSTLAQRLSEAAEIKTALASRKFEDESMRLPSPSLAAGVRQTRL